MSTKAEIAVEINRLKEMEHQFELYIDAIRVEQNALKNFMLLIEYTAWQQGNGKEAFFNRVSVYNEDFTKQIQLLENALLEIIETRNYLTKLYLAMSLTW